MSEHIDAPELDRCLAEDLAALHTCLDRVLDLDAGLADATLPGRTQAYTDDLDRVLDLEAGLAAILPTGQPPDTTPRRDALVAPSGDLGTGPATAETREVAELLRFARTLASMPAAARLHVRLWLPRLALSEIRLLVSMGRSTREDLRTRADALADDLDRAHARAGRNLDRDLAGNLDLARALAGDLDLARDLARTRTRNLDLDHARARSQARALAGALDLARARDRARTRTRDLDRTRARDLDHARARDLDLVHVRDLARDLAREFDLSYALARISSPGGMTSQKKSEFVRAVAADQAAEDLREEDLREAVEIMDRVVSDVVGADLGDVDLTGIPLEGVRWSSTTRWPPAWRMLVRYKSVKIGRDLWEVGRGGIDTDHLVTMA